MAATCRQVEVSTCALSDRVDPLERASTKPLCTSPDHLPYFTGSNCRGLLLSIYMIFCPSDFPIGIVRTLGFKILAFRLPGTFHLIPFFLLKNTLGDFLYCFFGAINGILSCKDELTAMPLQSLFFIMFLCHQNPANQRVHKIHESDGPYDVESSNQRCPHKI